MVRSLSLSPRLFTALLRLLSLVLLAALGTVVLMRVAPGYFSDARETDPRYADVARADLLVQRQEQTSLVHLGTSLVKGWLHGDLGRSREYDVPVTTLLTGRAATSARLVLCAVGCGWLIALALAIPLAVRRSRSFEALISAPTALLLAVPAGALATLCLVLDTGGPLLVLATLVGVRDFKLIYRLLRQTFDDPCFVHARAQGITTPRIILRYLWPRLSSQLVALATMSFVLALSAAVPIEVIFNVPGIGQLAWSAAMNRDLPVLLAITLLMASSVGLASMAGESLREEVLV